MDQDHLSQKTSTQSMTGEVPFSFDELFFSRTDERGIILSGNSVFQKISLFDWDGLLHKPHNIIRHPDMPKAVFWLLWDCIKKGKPIGAYVKNRAKDGRYYWVFAIVTPVEGGFLSVRLKPSSPIFSVVEQEYAALVALERNERLKPAESAEKLLNRLTQLGFKDYAAFMSRALSLEISMRDNKLGRPDDATIRCFDKLVEAAQSLQKEASDIFVAYAKSEYVPLNLRVQAAQLGESGATIGVISNNYDIISTEIRNSLNEFIASSQEVSRTIIDALFLVGTAKIQTEVLDFFHQEDSVEGISKEQEITFLDQQRHTYQKKALDGLHAITTQAELFSHACTEMKRLAAALEVTRIMGKVESARLSVSRSGLNELIDDLDSFQSAIAASLKEIDQMNRCIIQDAGHLLQAA